MRPDAAVSGAACAHPLARAYPQPGAGAAQACACRAACPALPSAAFSPETAAASRDARERARRDGYLSASGRDAVQVAGIVVRRDRRGRRIEARMAVPGRVAVDASAARGVGRLRANLATYPAKARDSRWAADRDFLSTLAEPERQKIAVRCPPGIAGLCRI